MNTLSLVLAAFVLSPANSGGLKPAISTGDSLTDWQTLAPTAESVAFDELPTVNIRQSWRKIGVKVLQRIAWDPECSAEYVRRRAGVLAVRDRADGTWLVDEEKFSPAWKAALAEAEIDAEAARYCRALAQEALAQRATSNKVWIEGRRLNWLFDVMDLERENLDTLRLEFVCYAKRLEQILGKTPKDLPLAVAKPTKEPDRAKFRPLDGRDVETKAVAPLSTFPLSDEVTFKSTGGGFSIIIAPKKPCAEKWPGGRGSLRLYLPADKGGYLPYEFAIDLSNVSTNRAPWPGTFLIERWGKGVYQAWADPTTWRFKTVPRGTFGSKYPDLAPQFSYQRDDKTGQWTVQLNFSWLNLYGFWPATRTGVTDRWYVALDALPGVTPFAVQLVWGQGRDANFDKYWKGQMMGPVSSRYTKVKARSADFFDFYHTDRLYGFLKTEKPTYHRLDPESDKIFKERVVQPMLDANEKLAATVYVKPPDFDSKTFHKLPEVIQKKTWRSLGRLFDLDERISVARRDYILMRAAGQLPPEPPKKKAAEEKSAGPDVESDDGEMTLDDELEI